LIPVPYKKKKGGRSPQSHRVNLCCLLKSFEIQSAHSDIPQTNPIPMAIGVVIAQNITNSHVCTLRNSVAVASSSCCVYRLVFIVIDGGFHPQPLVVYNIIKTRSKADLRTLWLIKQCCKYICTMLFNIVFYLFIS
jgi:hypothetical protein